MNIGTAAKLSGVPAKTIRYYEEVGVIRLAQRNASGYRNYSQNDVQTLHFIQRARSLGFSVKDVSKLLGLWHNKNRARGDVKTLALEHIEAIETKLGELEKMRDALTNLIARCSGGDLPDCPILAELADPEPGADKADAHSSI